MKDADGKKMEKPSVWIQQFTFWLLRSNSNWK
jgi:hypothetical protein